MTTRKEKISDLKAAIEGQVQLKRYYLSVHQQGDRTQTEIDRLRANAKKILDDAQRLEDARDNWQQRYHEADERVMELRQELLQTQEQDKIEQLMSLVEQFAGAGEEAQA